MSSPYAFEEYKVKKHNLLCHISSQIPNFEIIPKQKSILMKILNVVLFFISNFFEYTTAIYPKIYHPEEKLTHTNLNQLISFIEVMCHEYVHLKDRKRMWWVFNFLYLSPQILGLISILVIFNIWWLFGLILFLPLPSIGRAWIEYRGYRMSIAVRYWLSGEKKDIDNVVNKFVKKTYYFMFPFRKYLTKKFEQEFENIQKNNLTPELKEIQKILLTN